MKLTTDQIDQLRQQVALLTEKNNQVRQEMSFMQEKLSSQKMMLDEAISYSTRLEVQLDSLQS